MFVPTTLAPSPNASDLKASETYVNDPDLGKVHTGYSGNVLLENTRVLVLERAIWEMNSPVVKVKVLDGNAKGETGYLTVSELGPTLGDHISNVLWTIWRSTLGKDMVYN